jgi:hypothetical protein
VSCTEKRAERFIYLLLRHESRYRQNRELQGRHKIKSIPRLKCFKPGAEGSVQELASVVSRDIAQIKAKLSEFLVSMESTPFLWRSKRGNSSRVARPIQERRVCCTRPFHYRGM